MHMDTNRTFKVAGVAYRNDRTKPHFANNAIEDRTKVLEKAGFEHIKFFALPRKMNKPAAIAYLLREKASQLDDREKSILAKKIEGTRHAKLLEKSKESPSGAEAALAAKTDRAKATPKKRGPGRPKGSKNVKRKTDVAA